MQKQFIEIINILISNGFYVDETGKNIENITNADNEDIVDFTVSSKRDDTLTSDYRRRFYLCNMQNRDGFAELLSAPIRDEWKTLSLAMPAEFGREFLQGPAAWLFSQIYNSERLFVWSDGRSSFTNLEYLDYIKEHTKQHAGVDVSSAVDQVSRHSTNNYFEIVIPNEYIKIIQFFVVSLALDVDYFLCTNTFDRFFEIHHHKKIICYYRFNDFCEQREILECNKALFSRIY